MFTTTSTSDKFIKELKLKNLLIVLISTLMFSAFSNAATTSRTGKITDVKMFNTVFVIYLNEVEPACGKNHRRVAIESDHPLFSAVVSSALTAKTTGTLVEIGYKDSCLSNGAAWDFQHLWLKP
ncbi:hypothetical protein [Aliiglaciecola sp. M165]|uniref:hypothetical protein n=1 Tax=Aliiglaciecola sp. M165 TaxID=2593649 RepID=UPI00117BEFB6|nr:hypothetical protein [Aliiglaciecola sp. M165]TRY33406.1 hypothetical protein FM019_05375 [Aliiglaciecola sp. M165]